MAATGALRPARGTAAAEATEEAATAPAEPALRAGALLLFGSAVPGPFREAMAALAAAGPPGFRALHVLGARDAVNPPEGAREVAEALGGCVLEHPGGHDLPSDPSSVLAYAEFLAGEASAGDATPGQASRTSPEEVAAGHS
ncbi:unnamed protein product [Prorocentrum cordatum]|uniref:Serine hydrolase domain-containing protein n=1 Tax=Prorocentrum cordatum TaxID=2364126 RepID=A0ABN9VPM5_9DINO|nr:unnamed protein product [Polarella glacialis]